MWVLISEAPTYFPTNKSPLEMRFPVEKYMTVLTKINQLSNQGTMI